MTTTSFAGAKGGAGTTVAAAAFALELHRAGCRVIIEAIDLDDMCAVFGVAAPREDDERPVTVSTGLTIVELGNVDAALTSVDSRRAHIVQDLGVATTTMAGVGVLVTRACYLSLRRAIKLARPASVLVIAEAGRALGVSDIANVLNVRTYSVDYLESIARCIDAGLLTSARLPQSLATTMRNLPGMVAA